MSYSNYKSYAAFDADYRFSEKAGFQLTTLQIVDVEKFLNWDASLNSYEVGGGKSCVSTVVALMRGAQIKLVIVPPILITPWSRWLEKVTTGVCVYRGTPAQRKLLSIKDSQWVVMSHAIFRQDFNRIAAELGSSYEIIVDEAHALKSSASILYKKVSALMR